MVVPIQWVNIQQNTCHVLRSLGPSVTDASPATGVLYDGRQSQCADELGNLPGWSRAAARRRLASIASDNANTTGLKEFVQQMDQEMILQNAGLMKGLGPNEMKSLNLGNQDVVSAIGEFSGYTPEQLHAAFETWRGLSGRSNISAADILTLKNLVCGIPPEMMKSMMEPHTVKETIDALGHLATCSPRQLEELASKLTEDEGYGPNVPHWKMWEIAAAGHILGGLSTKQLSKLTPQQIHAIAPETITKLPTEKVQGFTTSQLTAFTDNQKNAITSMQRSYMTEEQMKIIVDPESRVAYGNGSTKALASRFIQSLFIVMIVINLFG